MPFSIVTEYHYILIKEAVVLIFNRWISREISRTYFTHTRAITYTYITDFHSLHLIVSRSLCQ